MCVDLDLVELNAWLEQFLNFEKQPDWEMLKLKTMQILAEKFGHPERACPCFHVTGSKGKGTIAANIAAILRTEDYTTGVYASPHVSHYVERVGTGAGPFSRAIYEAAFRELKTGVEELLEAGKLERVNVTWFELSTMFGMLCFREAKVDFAVYEVGLGGRLDATNIIHPECVVFGSIELEHTDFLGNSLVEIAQEKAGIMKAGVSVVSVFQEDEVEMVLAKKTQELGAEIDFLGRNDSYLIDDQEAAMRAVEKVLGSVDHQKAESALKKVQLPGRFERLENLAKFPDIPCLLIDVAHTPHSIKAVVQRLKQDKITGKLLFGCASDKKVEEMAKILTESGLFSEVFLTRPSDFKKSDLQAMERAFSRVLEGTAVVAQAEADFRRFIPVVLERANIAKEPLIVLGSFYLAAEVKKCL